MYLSWALLSLTAAAPSDFLHMLSRVVPHIGFADTTANENLPHRGSACCEQHSVVPEMPGTHFLSQTMPCCVPALGQGKESKKAPSSEVGIPGAGQDTSLAHCKFCARGLLRRELQALPSQLLLPKPKSWFPSLDLLCRL